MTDKVTKFERMAMTKPVPMKLFAAWEVDRTPSNCIPRLCSLTITRLSLLTPLPPDLTSLSLAVKMQSSKRTLRSHEIPVPQSLSTGFGSSSIGGPPGVIGQSGQLNSPPLLETELDLHFSLQYPHFIKRDGNRLLILLQRRKKYKTRTILGYKTLAEGVIRMDAVLQKSMDMTVELNGSGKAGRQGLTIATLRATQVSSIPVDQDNKNNNSLLVTDRVNEYSDEDEEQEFSSGDENDDGLSGYAAKRNYAGKRDAYKKFDHRGDNDGEGDDGNLLPSNQVDSDSDFDNMGKDKGSRAKMSRQRNFKQRIISLLKRFKVPDELEGDVPERGPSLRGKRDLDALFQELESLSCGEGDDSGQDMDSLSIGSTPKPSLRPFFENSKPTLQHQQSAVQLSSLQKSSKDFMPEKKTILEKRDSLAEKKSNSVTIANNLNNSINNNNISNNNHTSNYNNSLSNSQDRSGDWKNDSSGNEGGAGNTDPEALSSDPQNTGSPPKEKEPTAVEKKNRLFRTSSSTPNSAKKQKQSLSFTSTSGGDQQQPKASPLETCLSPTNVEPRKSLLEQLSRTFTTEESLLPDVVTIMGPPEGSSSSSFTPRLVSLISNTFRPTFSPNNTAEVKAITQALMNKIQKYCNSTAKPPTTVKVLLVGGDWLQGAVLRHYVELLGIRPPDWVNHIRFYIIPLGSCGVARYLSVIDSSYSSMFGTENWQQICDRAANLESAQSKNESAEIISRIQRYLHSSGPCTQVPIAEAMVNYRDEDSCQIFVPFISDVRIGCTDGPQLSLDLEESFAMGSGQSADRILSSSPPQSGRASPPAPLTPALVQQSSSSGTQESLELQVDYWPLARPILDAKEKSQSKGQDPSGKNSIKSTFRHLQVWRLPLAPNNGEYTNGLTLSYATKEKKQKSVMRLGKKKEKDRDAEKEQCVEGVARLICSPKQSHPVPLRVYIDGTEWTGVKFFQLSSQWQTHIKNFPIALVGAPLASAEMLT